MFFYGITPCKDIHRQKCRFDFTDQLHDCNDWQMFRAFQTDSIKWNNIPSPPTHPPTPQKMSGVYSLILDNNKQMNCFDVTICFYLMTDKKRLDCTDSMTVCKDRNKTCLNFTDRLYAKTDTKRVWTLRTDSMSWQRRAWTLHTGSTSWQRRVWTLRTDFTQWQRQDVSELYRLTVLTATRRVWT